MLFNILDARYAKSSVGRNENNKWVDLVFSDKYQSMGFPTKAYIDKNGNIILSDTDNTKNFMLVPDRSIYNCSMQIDQYLSLDLEIVYKAWSLGDVQGCTETKNVDRPGYNYKEIAGSAIKSLNRLEISTKWYPKMIARDNIYSGYFVERVFFHPQYFSVYYSATWKYTGAMNYNIIKDSIPQKKFYFKLWQKSIWWACSIGCNACEKSWFRLGDGILNSRCLKCASNYDINYLGHCSCVEDSFKNNFMGFSLYPQKPISDFSYVSNFEDIHEKWSKYKFYSNF